MVEEHETKSLLFGLKDNFNFFTQLTNFNISSMENLEQQFLDLKTTGRSLFLEIPQDLLIEILTRSPAKSIARFRCVSKIWKSILSSPKFTELYLSRSLSRPRLIFIFIKNKNSAYFFSTPQPQNQDEENSSLVAVVDSHKRFFAKNGSMDLDICRPVNGFICVTENRGWEDAVPMILNLSTGQSKILPSLKVGRFGEKHYLGYDPIDTQLKLLRARREQYTSNRQLHIITCGTRNCLWRELKCNRSHHPSNGESICITGVLYDLVSVGWSQEISLLVCFDVRSEKSSSVNIPEGLKMGTSSLLINFKGKIGALHSRRWIDYGMVGFLELWVLDDPEKQLWSKKMYQLPSTWQNIIQNYEDVNIVGMTSTGQFVLSPSTFSGDPFYVFFYHPEKNSIVRVEIQGTEKMTPGGYFETFIDYIEDVNLCKLIT